MWLSICCSHIVLAQSYSTDSTSQTIFYDAVVKISTDTIADTVRIADCGLQVNFQSDMTAGPLYADSLNIPRNSIITFCPPDSNNQLLFVFDHFDVEAGDTLYAYEGIVTHAMLEGGIGSTPPPTGSGASAGSGDTPPFIPSISFIAKASGTGASIFNGGWMSANCDHMINPSGCVTFNFKTDGDFFKATGWDASISCLSRTVSLMPPDHVFVDLTCEEDKKAFTIDSVQIVTGIDTTGFGSHFIEPEDCSILDNSIIIDVFNAIDSLCDTDTFPANGPYTSPLLAIGTYTLKYSLKSDPSIQVERHLAISPPPMICNDNINVSLDGACGFTLSPDDILENPCDLTTAHQVRYEMSVTLGSGHNIVKVFGNAPITGSGSSSSASTLIVEVPRDSIDKAGISRCGGQALVEVRRIYDYGNTCCSASVVEDICWGYVNFQDETPPIAYKLTKDTITACNADLAHLQNLLVKPIIIDNCDSTVTTELVEADRLVGARCDPVSKYATTWKIEDDCGNQTILRDTVYVVRPTAADIVPLPDIEFSCGEDFERAVDDLSLTGIPKFALSADTFALSLDSYFCDFILVKNDEIIPYPGGIKLIRFWSMSDQCAERPIPIPVDTQLIEFIDTLAPTLICPANGRLETADRFRLDAFECTKTVQLDPPAAIDLCDSDPRVAMFVVEKLVNGRWDSIAPNLGAAGLLTADTFRVGWRAYDNGGLPAKDTCHSYFILDDVTPPSAICKDELHISTGGNGFPIIRPEDIDDISWDACGILNREIRRTGDEIWGPQVNLECIDIYDPVRVELRITDVAGNHNSCWVFVNMIDDVPPVCHELEDAIAHCDEFYTGELGPTTDTNEDGFLSDLEWVTLADTLLEIFNQRFGQPLCEDNLTCRALHVEQEYQLIYRQCGEADILRRYRVIDIQQEDQFTNWQIQRITIAYRPNWQITFPADWAGECGDELPEIGLQIDRGACDILAWEHEEQVFDLVQDACYQVNRTYYVINWCTYEAGMEPIEVFRDENAAGEVNENIIIDFNSHNNYGYYKYTQIIKVDDFTAPTVTINPVQTCIYGVGDVPPIGEADITPGTTPFECDTIRVFSAEASDCEDTFFKNFSFEYWIYEDGIEVGHGEEAKFFWTVQPKIDYTVRFRVNDNCGNVGEQEEIFQFWDCTPPTIVCQDTIITSIGVNGTALASPAVIAAASYDNCTLQSDLDYRIWHPKESDEAPRTIEEIRTLPNALALGCEYLGHQRVQVYILDNDDNFSSCITQIFIDNGAQDCTGLEVGSRATIGGKILTKDGVEVEQVAIQVSGMEQTETPYQTNLDGIYHFELDQGLTYRIEPHKDINPLNGVTTFDLVLISKHILGIDKIESPYYQIAADINHNGQITAFDLVQLRQLILNIVSEFPSNESWRFVDASYVFETEEPLEEPFNESIEVQLEEEDRMTNDFVAIKIGDVNGSATPNTLRSTTTRNATGYVEMTLPDQRVEKGQTIDLTFHMDQLKQLEGLQFALAFPNLDLINRKESMLQQAHMGWQLKEQHLLPISWTQVGERKEDNKDFLRLTFQANKEGWLSDLISLQQELLSAEAYTIEQEQLGIKLIFEQDEAVFEVLQNRPNPFKESTTIGFHLPTDDRVSLSILSMDGKVVKEWTQPFEKGFNEWTIHRRDFNLTGLLHYQIATSQQVITRKMIVLE